MKDYPAGLPCPLVKGYKWVTDAGLNRFDSQVLTDQGRLFATMPTLIDASFVLNTKVWGIWHKWVTVTGREWVRMPMASMYNSLLGPGAAPLHTVRLASSSLKATLRANNDYEIDASFELSPTMFLLQLETP